MDTGTLVLTNQRLVFTGGSRAVSVPPAKLIHVDAYSDGITVFKEGREAGDTYLTPRPGYLLLILNWYLEHGSAAVPQPK